MPKNTRKTPSRRAPQDASEARPAPDPEPGKSAEAELSGGEIAAPEDLNALSKWIDGAVDELDSVLYSIEEKLRELCRQPQRAVDVFPALFKSKITDSNLIMATGEAIAHLNYLFYEGELAVDKEENGVRWYRSR